MDKTIIRFWGCRGSFPCSEKNKQIYGGDTSCIEIRTPDNNTIILDMGTGLKRLGQKIINDSSYNKEIHIFLSHFHLDHIHGFVMFAPLFNPNYNIKIYSRQSNGKSLITVLEQFLQPEIWPISLDDLPAKISFIDIDDKSININSNISITNQLHAHPNKAYSIGIESFNKKIVYATDCEHPKQNLNPNVVNFATDSDILIHDAQYTPNDLKTHIGWGHSSWEQAAKVASESGSKQLILFHHSPDYDDNKIKDIERKARFYFPNIMAAKQDLKIEL